MNGANGFAAVQLGDVIIEAQDLEDVSAAEEDVRLSGGDAAQLTPPLVENIIEHLRELSDQAAAAADCLSARA